MELVLAEDVFNEAKFSLEGRDDKGNPYPVDLDKSERLLNEILCQNLGHPIVLYVLASLHLTRGNYGLAIQLFTQITQAEPTFGEAWNNLGMAFRGVNEWDKAAYCCKKAGKYIDHPDVPTNVSGLHLNRGTPEIALEWADKALAKDSDHVKAQWHKAMALLEMSRWDEAWELHETRLIGGANENIWERNYHGPDGMTPMWDGVSHGTVVIHGEQGMGDEIMFSSCIPDALATGADIILEPSPRLERLFVRSFPDAHLVHGTDHVDGRGWIENHEKPDFKLPLGSLPKLFRRNPADCPRTPYLKADPHAVAGWRAKLNKLGDRPRIGLAWQGGVPSTRNEARSFHPLLFEPLFKEYDATWVSLQYDATARMNVDEVLKATGTTLHHWPEAVEARHPETGKPNDIDALVSLIASLDLVISVCQTTIHVAGALGIPCWCLTPSQPSWRYSADSGEVMHWYGSVTQIRQAKDTRDWTPVVEEVNARLAVFLREREGKAA